MITGTITETLDFTLQGYTVSNYHNRYIVGSEVIFINIEHADIIMKIKLFLL